VNAALDSMKIYRIIITVLLFIIAMSPAYADRCWLTGGCEGRIGYMHLPHAQMESDYLFTMAGNPAINEEVTLKRNGFFFDEKSVTDKRFEPDLVNAIKNKIQLAWGGELASGAKVIALEYKTFPQLNGELRNEIFLLVSVLTVQ
tara:strand:+ start:1147 stop:1581 length:435 start_codon:yes stop_codon:yes gene_type:complete